MAMTAASGAAAPVRGWWTAPADRPKGHRGVRGGLAAGVAVLAVAVMSAREWHGRASGGGGVFGSGGSLVWTANGWRSWAPPLLLGLAGGLLVAAAGMWVARSRAIVLLATALAAGCLGAAGWTVAVAQGSATVSRAGYAAIAPGMTRRAVERALGVPWTTNASLTLRSGRTLPCDMYQAAGSGGFTQYVFCFRNGRLAEKTEQ